MCTNKFSTRNNCSDRDSAMLILALYPKKQQLFVSEISSKFTSKSTKKLEKYTVFYLAFLNTLHKNGSSLQNIYT